MADYKDNLSDKDHPIWHQPWWIYLIILILIGAGIWGYKAWFMDKDGGNGDHSIKVNQNANGTDCSNIYAGGNASCKPKEGK